MKLDPKELKARLTPKQYEVVVNKATEPAFTGEYVNNHEQGMYTCVSCGQELFSSTAKFDSQSGWPSFDQPVNRAHVDLIEDTSHGMHRTEVVCKNCGAHLGHVFPDGPKETTGERYCINSCSLSFEKK